MARTFFKKKPEVKEGTGSSAKEVLKRIAAKSCAASHTTTQPAQKISKKELEGLHKRDVIIEQYMPYATSIASKVCQTLSIFNEYDEVLCNARLGLLEAAKRFDASQNIDFKTFAYYRIKGAIFDGLRKSGWIPRTLYAKIKFEEATNDYLQFMSDRASAKTADVANKEEEICSTVNNLASIYIISIESQEDFDIEDPNAVDSEKQAEMEQIKTYMREAIDSLPDKEKKLVKMYYFQNKTLEEAGARLGLSKSWTSRLHVRALELLMKRIKNRSNGGPPPEDDNGGEF
jgi:RNA polymerase sigma factor for flagellar operon FliA